MIQTQFIKKSEYSNTLLKAVIMELKHLHNSFWERKPPKLIIDRTNNGAGPGQKFDLQCNLYLIYFKITFSMANMVLTQLFQY